MRNINIGILGHVDSGKTTLAKKLSTISSTASFDKNPQSTQRGITLDLGFSSFKSRQDENLQYTLVDCPGHSSLIKTIIGGAQIIDLMMLVIDVTKGIQTQTAECILLGKILCPKLLVVFNKADLAVGQGEATEKKLLKTKKEIKLKLSNMGFKRLAFAQVSALTGQGVEESLLPILHDLTGSAVTETEVERLASISLEQSPFTMAVDHCFNVKGKGTVLTGTVISGQVKIDDQIQLPEISFTEKRKVKSIQVFRQPVQTAIAGDRCGLCIGSNFDASSFERGVACQAGSANFANSIVLKLNVIDYYKKEISSKETFHISIGHTTRTAKVTLFHYENDAKFNDQTTTNASPDESETENFSRKGNYLWLKDSKSVDPITGPKHIFIHLEFTSKPILCFKNSLIVASKLDIDISHESTTGCRLAFYGRIQDFNFEPLIYKPKIKSGTVDRLHNAETLIVKNIFKKETNLELFTGLKVVLDTGETGKIVGPFGKSGKIKVEVDDDLEIETIMRLDVKLGKKQESPIKVELRFFKRAFSKDDKIYQF